MILNKNNWKVGELAKQTGLTVRMLHHYDKIGLFSPSQHSETGHRLYTESDIVRLQQIMSLKLLGFALEEIKEILENQNFNPLELIKVQLDDVKKRIRLQELLCSRLEKIYELLNNQQEVTHEQFINLIEVINLNKDKYFTQEQQEKMFKQFGLEKRKQYVSEWSDITAKIRVEYEKGTPPEDLDVTQLATQWNEFLKKLTFDDPEISKAAERYYKENPEIGEKFGVQLSDYIKKAMYIFNILKSVQKQVQVRMKLKI
ncbi:MerR family transcriptional regulator [Fictibacillus sp. WQ 8-8]|uniref:MerR family transcriptional regulator n=1 Tax=Fictibacillus sp. WQ 8-8 TaxID=2938788 RepID=UPI00210EAC17|nr:MerR family transcriptional regulator [Fictibacillus sp. WQ 8-8]MCQ6265121.1 MerR family transcriptional regulator [Fictibacillus sp. WQ 8-8]